MKHNPNWHFGGGNGVDFSSAPHLYAVGFSGFEIFSYDLATPHTPEAWRGRIRASAGIGASLPPDQVESFDAELARLLNQAIQHWYTGSTTGDTGNTGMTMVIAFPRDAP